MQITELGTHLQGQLVAVHPAYDDAFDAFAPDAVKGKPAARQRWAVEQMLLSARASRNLGLTSNVSFPGALAWPYLYPWPQRPAGLIEAAFDELANAGGRSSMPSTTSAATSASSCIPAKPLLEASRAGCR